MKYINIMINDGDQRLITFLRERSTVNYISVYKGNGANTVETRSRTTRLDT